MFTEDIMVRKERIERMIKAGLQNKIIPLDSYRRLVEERKKINQIIAKGSVRG